MRTFFSSKYVERLTPQTFSVVASSAIPNKCNVSEYKARSIFWEALEGKKRALDSGKCDNFMIIRPEGSASLEANPESVPPSSHTHDRCT